MTTPERAMGQVMYSHIAPDTELWADQARQEFGHDGMCRVINHKVELQISYLIELPDGERRWIPAH